MTDIQIGEEPVVTITDTSEAALVERRSSEDQKDIESRLDPFFVVGIGASAGGLEALEELFASMPTDTGAAFVVVQHLSPNFKSLMDELLARHTRMPIYRAQNGLRVEPDSVYLLTTRQEVLIVDGALHLRSEIEGAGPNLPIDRFFFSLAEDCGAYSVAVVLSGSGSDGSRGVRAIHEAGGLVLVQSLQSAKFDGMPMCAVDSGVADLITQPSRMGRALEHYVKHPLREGLAAEVRRLDGGESPQQETLRLLNEGYCIDFSNYKPATIQRRTDRRVMLSGTQSLEEYNQVLREDDKELRALYRDLLIGVTRFFRDTEAFERMAEEILERLRACPLEQELRIWVAGCATGEEAYSLAILVDEACRDLNRIPNVRIFATDIDRTSLSIASAGVYPHASLDDVSPERRSRYFISTGLKYQVVPELRRMVVFAPHNLLADAPFTRIDVVTCRNLLIYFNTNSQKRVLRHFHYALRVMGVLFLGPSETLAELASEFTVVDSYHKIFRKIREARLTFDYPATQPQAGRSAPAQVLETTPASYRRPLVVPDQELIKVYDELLEVFMPAAILVDTGGEILHVFGNATQYLGFNTGRASSLLLDHMDGELRVAVAGAFQRAQKTKVKTEFRAWVAEFGEDQIEVAVRSLAAKDGERRYLVLLRKLEPVTPPSGPSRILTGAEGDAQQQIELLEEELRYAKENLQATIEELESSNEELQATNEEMVASNEELQSTNEELHSVNEELYTVNGEYQLKIEELMELSNDLENLFASTRIHTIFLDRDLRLRKFTPGIGEVFNLVASDVGRRIDNFAHSIDHWDLNASFKKVLESGRPIEDQVRARSGAPYLLRILPYKAGGATNGVVMTLVDIGNLQQVERSVADQARRFQTLADSVPVMIWEMNENQEWTYFNPVWRAVAGLDPEKDEGGWMDRIDPEDLDRRQNLFLKSWQDQSPFQLEFRLQDRSGSWIRLFEHAVPRFDGEGEFCGFFGCCLDVTHREIVRSLRRDFLRGLDQAILWANLEDGSLLYANSKASGYLGWSINALLHMRLSDIDPDLGGLSWETFVQQVNFESLTSRAAHLRTQGGEILPCVLDLSTFTAEEFPSVLVVTLTPVEGKPDLSIRRAASEPPFGLWDWEPKSGETWFADSFLNVLGFRSGEIVLSFEGWSERLEDKERILAELEEKLNSDFCEWETVYRIRNRDSVPIWVKSKMTLKRDSSGQPLRLTSVIQPFQGGES